MSTFEFIVAQALSQIRGFVFSLFVGLLSILVYLGIILNLSVPNGCIFIIVISVMSLGVFVLSVVVASRHKLRQRNDIIPYHMFAENQFESDHKQNKCMPMISTCLIS